MLPYPTAIIDLHRNLLAEEGYVGEAVLGSHRHLAGDHHAVRVGRRGLVTKFQYFVNIISFHDMESSYKVSLEDITW